MKEFTRQYAGWSNEATMFAWGIINPLGTMFSKEKPSLTYKDREKDKVIIIEFLKKRKGIDLKKVNIEEILDYLYR